MRHSPARIDVSVPPGPPTESRFVGDPDTAPAAARSRSLNRRVIALTALGALILLGRRGIDLIPVTLQAIRDLGPWAVAAYFGVYVIATVAFVPGSILSIASGAIFGLLRGWIYTLCAATLGAVAAFLVARYLARGEIERRLGQSDKLDAIDRAVGREGGRLVFLLRLSPALPFNVMNYALGLTSLRVRDYAVASFFGMAPGTFLYVYAGYAAGQVAMGGQVQPRGFSYWALLGVGLIATVAVTVLVTRVARQAIRRATEGDAPDSA